MLGFTAKCTGRQGWGRLLRCKQLFGLSVVSAALAGVFAAQKHFQPAAVLGPQDHWIRTLAFSPDGRQLAAGGGLVDRGSELIIWDPTRGSRRTLLLDHTACIEAVAFSPDGRWLGVVDREQTARLLEAATGKEHARFRCGPAWQQFVAFSADSRRLLVPDFDGSFLVWDIAGQRQNRLSPPFAPASAAHAGVIHDLLAMDLASGLFTLCKDGTGRLFSMDVPTPIWSSALSSDERIVALAGREGRLYFCEPATGRTWRTEEPLEDRANSLAFSPDGQMLVSGGQDGALRLWQTATGRALGQLGSHDAAVFAVAFAPDGGQVASGGFDKRVRLWPTPGGAVPDSQGALAGWIGKW